jgi:hypothetical protein
MAGFDLTVSKEEAVNQLADNFVKDTKYFETNPNTRDIFLLGVQAGMGMVFFPNKLSLDELEAWVCSAGAD